MIDINKALIRLNRLEDFIAWRDEICKPILDDIEACKLQVLTMDEATLKSLIMYENTIKKLFFTTFEEAKEVERSLNEQEEREKNEQRSTK